MGDNALHDLANSAVVTAILGGFGALGAWIFKLWRTAREDKCSDQQKIIQHYDGLTDSLKQRVKDLVAQLTAAGERADRETTELAQQLSRCHVEVEATRGELRLCQSLLAQARGGVPFSAEDQAVTAVSVDQDGIILEAHPIITHLSHYFARELIGQPVLRLVPPRYHAAHLAGMQRVIEAGALQHEGRPMPVHLLRKDGDEIPVTIVVSGWKSRGRWFFSCLIQRRPEDPQPDPPAAAAAAAAPAPEAPRP